MRIMGAIQIGEVKVLDFAKGWHDFMEIQETDYGKRKIIGKNLKEWWSDAFEVCDSASCVSQAHSSLEKSR